MTDRLAAFPIVTTAAPANAVSPDPPARPEPLRRGEGPPRPACAAEAASARRRPESIEELFTALESPLLSYALRLLANRSLAEDTVQEAFMKLHAQFSEVREPRRWLYRTVHNLALNHQRQAGKIVPLHPNDGESGSAKETTDPQPLPNDEMARVESIGLVRLSLATLDERSRELIRLKFHEDLSYKQISERTGLSVGHVGYLLHHALKAIGAELAKTGEEF